MKEESQIDDMRAALRGDRERAEQARQRSTENVLALIDSVAREPEREPQPQQGRERPPSRLGRFFGR